MSRTTRGENNEDARLRPIRLRPTGRSQNWPKSKLAEIEQMVFALFLLSAFSCFLLFLILFFFSFSFSFSFSSFSSYCSFSFCSVCFCPQKPVPWTPNPEPSAGPPSAGPPSTGPPQKNVAFFSLPPQFSFFSSSLGVLSLNFGAGASHDSLRAETCTFQGPVLQTPPKLFHEKTERGKKPRNFVPPTLRRPTICGPKIQHPKIGRSRNWPKSNWPNSNWPNSKKKKSWPKSKLTEVDRAQKQYIPCFFEKAWPAEDRRRLHKNTAHAHFGFSALRIARAKTRVVPVSERVEACKLFLERGKKRVHRAQEVVGEALTQKAVHEEEVAEGERRLALLQAEAAQPEPLGTTSVTQLQQPIDALVRERDALRANPHQDGKWTGHGPPSAENIPVMPTDIQELHGWLSDRNCELWNAMEFGDAELVAKIGGLVGQGAVGVVGSQPRCAHGWGIPFCAHVKFDRRTSETALFGARCRFRFGHSELINSRYGLRGVRVGEATNPGPARERSLARERSPEAILSDLEADLTRLDSSDEEPLARPMLGRNVVRRVSVADDTLPHTDAAARSIGDAFRFSRRVVLVPQSAGTPQSVQDRSSNRFAILAPDPNHEDLSVSASNVGSQTFPAATLLDDLECHLTRVTNDDQDTRGSDIGGVAHFAEAVGTESVPGIDRRTRRRLSLVWRADIRDPVPVYHQADALGSHDQRFLRAPGPQHRLRRVLSEESPEISTLPGSTVPASQGALRNRGVELEAVRLSESSFDRGEDRSGPSECQSGQGPALISR